MPKRRARVINIRAHFLYKGRAMRVHHEHPPRIERQRDEVHRQIQKTFRGSLRRIKPRRILDVGTGFGTSTEMLARRFRDHARIWSIDASPQVLSEVRDVLKAKGLAGIVAFRHANAEALPFSHNRFDLVVSLLSLHHIANPTKGLHEMARVLASKGKMVVADWKPVDSPVVPHKARDIPSSEFVSHVLKDLNYSVIVHEGRYYYLVEAIKSSV